jgi:hypothetical protein
VASAPHIQGAQVQRDPLAARRLVHELGARAGVARQEATTHQFVALARQIRHLQRAAQALGQPLDQVLLLRGRHLDGVAHLGCVDGMCDSGLADKFLAGAAGSCSDGFATADSLPLPVREPAGGKHQRKAGGHATPAPPLAGALARIGQPLRRRLQSWRHGFVQQRAMQARSASRWLR